MWLLQEVARLGVAYILGNGWYRMKYNGEEHFEFVHHNVFAHDMHEGKM